MFLFPYIRARRARRGSFVATAARPVYFGLFFFASRVRCWWLPFLFSHIFALDFFPRGASKMSRGEENAVMVIRGSWRNRDAFGLTGRARVIFSLFCDVSVHICTRSYIYHLGIVY